MLHCNEAVCYSADMVLSVMPQKLNVCQRKDIFKGFLAKSHRHILFLLLLLKSLYYKTLTDRVVLRLFLQHLLQTQTRTSEALLDLPMGSWWTLTSCYYIVLLRKHTTSLNFFLRFCFPVISFTSEPASTMSNGRSASQIFAL